MSPPPVETNGQTRCVNGFPLGARYVETLSEERAVPVHARECESGSIERLILELGLHEALHQRFTGRAGKKEWVLCNLPFPPKADITCERLEHLPCVFHGRFD